MSVRVFSVSDTSGATTGALASVWAAAPASTRMPVLPSFTSSPMASAPLFTRLGGPAAVDAIVSDTLDAVASTDASVSANLPATKRQLSNYICARTGGGCSGNGGAGEISALLEPLRVALRAHNVPLAARNELLEVLISAGPGLARL